MGKIQSKREEKYLISGFSDSCWKLGIGLLLSFFSCDSYKGGKQQDQITVYLTKIEICKSLSIELEGLVWIWLFIIVSNTTD